MPDNLESFIPEDQIPKFIKEIESCANIWNYRLQSSFRQKQKGMAAVAHIFNDPPGKFSLLHTISATTRTTNHVITVSQGDSLGSD